MKLHHYFICLFVLLASTSNAQKNGPKGNFKTLQSCMQGSFNSAEQSKNDSDYFDIRLRMVPIWSSTPEVFYLYVEQAVANYQEKPYRQRIYKVEKQDDQHFVSRIYMIPGQERCVGKGSDDAIFKQLSPDSLTLKDGCEVYLTFDKKKKTFTGATNENTCPSDRQGAMYATSKVTIWKDQMVSWDQGWDAQGKQVWGAVKGGYIFKKQK